MASWSWIRRLFAGVLIGLALSSPALADDLQRAKASFSRAEARYQAGDHEGALKLYEEAYRLKPLPGFHFNIAQCHHNLKNYAAAVRHYQEYLVVAKSSQHREIAERLLKVSQEELARQQPASSPAEEREELPPDTAAAGPASRSAAPTGAPAGRRKLRPVYFWSGVGVTGALLLTGTVTGILALTRSSLFKDPATPVWELRSLKDSGEALKTTSTVTFALGGAAAAATAALYFFTDFGKRERAVAAMPISGGGMLLVGGRY